MQGCSSVGRAKVSKTLGRGFEPCRPCHSTLLVWSFQNPQKEPLGKLMT